MPTKSLPSTTGTPEMPRARVSCSTCSMLVSGVTVMGFLITPLSYFLTAATSAAWRSMLMFLWMMPMPPSCAMAMASRASVTVSMAALMIGMLSRTSRASGVRRLTWRGSTSE
jgi:hypothetical protein